MLPAGVPLVCLSPLHAAGLSFLGTSTALLIGVSQLLVARRSSTCLPYFLGDN
jgi:hypothetical protein